MFLVLHIFGYSQNYYCDNITSSEGLPGNSIRSIFQDSRGYMWIGTDAGLSRWDGHTFTIYNTLDGLAGNKVWCIDEDNMGNMWFSCFGAGISTFDGSTFTSYTDKDGLVDNSARIVKYCSKYDCIAIGTNKAISILKDSTFYNFTLKNGALYNNVTITGIMENDRCIEFYNFSSHHYCVYFKDETPYVKLSNLDIGKYDVSSVFKSKSGTMFYGWSREGIIKQNDLGITKIPDIGQVFGIAEDCSKNIWAASWNGGGISPPGGLFKISNGKITRLNSSYNINSILGWSAYFEEKQNLIFYGTLDKGLFKIPPQYFKYYPSSFFGESNLNITNIEIDALDNIWFVSDSLLVEWDKVTYNKKDLNFFYNLRLNYETKTPTNFKERISTLNDHYFHRNTHFTDIEFDNYNNAWLNCSNLGFFKIPNKSIDSTIFHSTYVVNDFQFNSEDTLFQCGSWSTMLRKFKDFNNSEEFIAYYDSLHPINSKFIRGYQNEVWVSSRVSDLFLYDKGKLTIITEADSTINKIVNDICFDNEGYAYLGGSDGRIEMLAPETRKKLFEIKHKGHNHSILWLNVSKELLFVGCSDGLRVYKLNEIKNGKTKFHFFTASDGYRVPIVNSTAIDTDGNLWLATNNGLVKIEIAIFLECEFETLTTIIRKVEIFNTEVKWAENGKIDYWSGLPQGTANLDPNQNHVSIYFHTLNFNNTDADLYYYKLDGIDKGWVGPTDKNNVVYPFLNSGSYKFLAKSVNSLSGLESNQAEFQFVILTPWYKQIWFYIITSVLFFIVLFIVYKKRINLIKKKEEDKRGVMQKISELEIKALQAQMNPHFLFNAINSIQNYILDNDVDKALSYLSSFSKVVRKTLEFVDQQFVSLSEVLNYLQNYVSIEKMRFDEMFDYSVICDNDIDPDTTLIPPMLLQPIIENSIKHGIQPLKYRGIINVEIVKINDVSIKCIIEDNGIGRSKSSELNKRSKVNNDSIGLKITKERLEILNNNYGGNFNINIIDLYSEKREPIGTRVEITLGIMLD